MSAMGASAPSGAAQSDLTLDLSGLSGVILYEPEELVLSAQAGTPLDEIEALLAERGQHLAFRTDRLWPAAWRRAFERDHRGAFWRPISAGRGGSRPARRAITSWASRPCQAGASPSRPAAGV